MKGGESVSKWSEWKQGRKDCHLFLDDDLASRYPRAANFLDAPVRNKTLLVCPLLEQFFEGIGADGYVETQGEMRVYERIIMTRQAREEPRPAIVAPRGRKPRVARIGAGPKTSAAVSKRIEEEPMPASVATKGFESPFGAMDGEAKAEKTGETQDTGEVQEAGEALTPEEMLGFDMGDFGL